MSFQTDIATIEAAVSNAAAAPAGTASAAVAGVADATIRTDSYKGKAGSGFLIVASYAGLARIKNIGPETAREVAWPATPAAFLAAGLAAMTAFWNSLTPAQKGLLASQFAGLQALRASGDADAIPHAFQAFHADLPDGLNLSAAQAALLANALTQAS